MPNMLDIFDLFWDFVQFDDDANNDAPKNKSSSNQICHFVISEKYKCT